MSDSPTKLPHQETEDLLVAAEQAAHDGRRADATRLYQEALRLDPNHAVALRQLACVHEQAGDFAAAAEVWKRLVAARPQDARAHQDLGLALLRIGNRDEGVAALRRTVALEPNYAPGHCNLGLALEECGDFVGATAELRLAQRLQPESSFIAYHLAAVAAQAGEPHAVVKACPRDYLVPLFDGYADRFDAHLFQTLRYNGPQLLGEIVNDVPTAARRPLTWDVLDLGCGTGMTGVPFRDAARTITGVDLSRRMLERAARRVMPDGRRVYDELLECDLVAALNRLQGQCDLILAADVFIYVGDLREVFAEVRSALRTNGLFAFTIEVWHEAEDFRLLPTRRYAQSPTYIVNLACETGLLEVERRSATLRLGERLEPVEGLVFLLRSPGYDK